MYYRLILVMLLFLHGIVQAQTENFRVHFRNDSYELDNTGKYILNKILHEAKAARYAEVYLSAHTDNNADDAYNTELSCKRAQAVASYLQQEPKLRVSMKWYGENKPRTSNADDGGKRENRRVEIAFTKYNFENLGQLAKMASDNQPQAFTVSTGQTSVIKGSQGTTITIPPDAFETKSGKHVTSSAVTITLEELQRPADAAFSQLSTVCDGRILETGGMFSVSASLNGEELQVKKGKKLDVQMPSKNMQENMQLFTAVKNTAGVTEWKTTAEPFKTEKAMKEDKIYTTVNTAYLKSLSVIPCATKLNTASTTYILPNAPRLPYRLRKPRLAAMPYERSYTMWERMSSSRSAREKKAQAERIAVEEANNARMERYEKRLARYPAEYAKYQADSLAFENNEGVKFREWLNAHQQHSEQVIAAIKQKCFNRAIAWLIDNSDKKTLNTLRLKSCFIGKENPNHFQWEEIYHKQNLLSTIDALSPLSLTDIITKHARNGKIQLDPYVREWRWHGCGMRNPNSRYLTAGTELLENDPEFAAIFTKAEDDLLAKREKAGKIDKSLTRDVYYTSVASTGMYNCDRFSDIPQNAMAKVRIRYNEGAQLSFYVPSIKSYIYAYTEAGGYYVNLPKNKEVTMVLLDFKDKTGPVFCCEKKTFTSDILIEPSPGPASLRDIRDRLASL